MERQTNDPHPEDVLDLVTNQVDQAICTALDSLTDIFASPEISLQTSRAYSTPADSLRPMESNRCRSSSRNDRREGKVSFHHTMPRCSLPATKTDPAQYHARSLSFQPAANQARCRSSQNVNGNGSNRSFDVQYSFSLNKPWQRKIDKQRHHLIGIQNFVNELVEHSIRTAFLQVRWISDPSVVCDRPVFASGLDRLSKSFEQ